MPAFVTIDETGAIDTQLARVDVMLRRQIVPKGLRAGANVVKKSARVRAPRSKQTGTREQWSEKIRAERAGVKEHADTIGVVVREYDDYFVAVVGAQWPAGALASLIADGHKLVAWGNPTDVFVVGNDYLTPAADETVSQQQIAVIGRVTREVAMLLKPV